MEYVFYGVARAAVNPPIMGYGQCFFADYTYPTLPDAQHTRCMTLSTAPSVPLVFLFIYNVI
jgi:hypothetical protein